MFPSEYDLLAIRKTVKDFCTGGELDTVLKDRGKDYIAGYRKSIRCLYHTVGVMVYEPMEDLQPISENQRKVIGITENETGEAFEGLTKNEAGDWINKRRRSYG